mmetsp:Transcript_359/g.335  ORF Transcript_359/g.335 Transcript_359/m.335 type:complete len:269 (-) Transcript_359:107-913(-)
MGQLWSVLERLWVGKDGLEVDVSDSVLTTIKKALKYGDRMEIRKDSPPYIYQTVQSVTFPEDDTEANAKVNFNEFSLLGLEISTLIHVVGTKKQIAKEIASAAKNKASQKLETKLQDLEKSDNKLFLAAKGVGSAAKEGASKLADSRIGSLAKERTARLTERVKNKKDSNPGEDSLDDINTTEDSVEEADDTEITQDTLMTVVINVTKDLQNADDIQVQIVEIKTDGPFGRVLETKAIQKKITEVLSKKISAAISKKIDEKLKQKGFR